MLRVGKQEFTLHTSKYIKKAEKNGEEIIITCKNRPTLKLISIKPKKITDLFGTISKYKVNGDINDPIFPGYDEW